MLMQGVRISFMLYCSHAELLDEEFQLGQRRVHHCLSDDFFGWTAVLPLLRAAIRSADYRFTHRAHADLLRHRCVSSAVLASRIQTQSVDRAFVPVPRHRGAGGECLDLGP